MDRSQQGVVPRTCLSKYAVKPRVGPPRQGTPPTAPQMRAPGPRGAGVLQPRPLSPASGRSSPHPPALSPANGRMSPVPRPSTAEGHRGRSNSNASYAGQPSHSPGLHGTPKMQRPRSNSASQVMAKRASPPGPSPMNPNANSDGNMPSRKPLPGLAM
jgi:hypothetical protein